MVEGTQKQPKISFLPNNQTIRPTPGTGLRNANRVERSR